VVGLAAVLRDEVAECGVGVSVLCPGLVRTRIFESERNRQDGSEVTHSDPAVAASMREVIEHGVDPAAVADAVFHAVIGNKLFVIPTSDVRDLILSRIDEVRLALPPD
jgi:short-subunit dehydrogenase